MAVENTNIIETLNESFLEYAGYNIQRRAIPDARDGLKWGARQLLHAQMLGKFTYDKPFKKAIKSVSQAMGFSYVHGDASAYGTFIRMAKPFVMNVPLQEANGNYGTLIDPDDHSASRYVEMRGSEAAAYMLRDLDKDTITEWEDTYDLEGKFPKVLPAKGIWGLVNGCISIGSGMSCSVAPMNLRELNEAFIKLLWNPDIADEEIIVMPDFPTGATILNADEVRESLKNGTGAACRIRATVEYDAKERCFIVKEMPYSTYTNTICNELAAIMQEDENCGIRDFTDYTGQEPDLRIYLTKTARPEKVLKRLYKDTSLQTFYSINMVLLDHGTTPRVFGMKEAMQAHLDHEEDVYVRGFSYDLHKINDRLHIIEGLLKAISILDEVIALIRGAADSKNASRGLQQQFGFTEPQAKAILDIKLSRLAHLEVSKLEKEQSELEAEKNRIEAILNDDILLKKEIEKGLREVAEKFGDARRTKILNITDEGGEPIEVKKLQLSLTNKNALFATEVSTLYTQRRGGVGNKIKLDNGEYIISTLTLDNTDSVLFFTQDGDYYSKSASELSIGEKIYAEALLNMKHWQSIRAIASTSGKEKDGFIIFITKKGYLKKSNFAEYNTNRNVGVRALTLEDGDEISNILFTKNDNIGIVTECGNFLMIKSDDVRAIGRTGRGIKTIKLNELDAVANAHLIEPATRWIVSISGSGLCKMTSIDEFSVQGKNTKGSKIQRLGESDWVADFAAVDTEKELFIAATNSCIRISLDEVPKLSKGAQGNKTIKLNEKENVVGLSKY